MINEVLVSIVALQITFCKALIKYVVLSLGKVLVYYALRKKRFGSKVSVWFQKIDNQKYLLKFANNDHCMQLVDNSTILKGPEGTLENKERYYLEV